jgi:hypothetical protein
MANRIAFHCPLCNQRLRAAPGLVGRTSPCPSCRAPITVPPQAPEEAAPLLVMDDGHRLGDSNTQFTLPQ